MDDALLEVIRNHAAACYPNEACGLLVAQGKKAIALPCENVAGDPKNFFMIGAAGYIAAAKIGKVIGVWHTHVEISPTASEEDIAGCERTGMDWFIIGIKKNEHGSFDFTTPTHIEPTGYQAPYLERPYFYGIYDCYSLVQDYYKREFSIELSDYSHIDKWWEKGYDFFSESFAAEGFVRLIDEEPQIGDLFLIQSGSKVANHVAIYLGDDMILHHCHGRLSRRDIYGGYWQKHTMHHLRHQSKC